MNGFREDFVGVIVSTFLISICLSVVTRGYVFLAVLFNLSQETTMMDLRYQS